MSVSLATEQASIPAAYRLYLPEVWAKNRQRCEQAGVPAEIRFQTKPEIALSQIRSLVEEGVPRGVVLADAAYGNDHDFREGLESPDFCLATREAGLHPDRAPKVNQKSIEEMVADKGYHSGALLVQVRDRKLRTYIPERQQKRQRKWAGKACQQQAVYANRRRVQGNYGKSLLKLRGELVERSFAHCYDTSGMRRTHLRKHENILKRQLVHVAGFNLSLIFRKVLGAGTPCEWKNRGRSLFLSFLGRFRTPCAAHGLVEPGSCHSWPSDSRCRRLRA